MHSILLDLNRTFANIEASAVVSCDGVVLASAKPEDMNEDNIGGLSAALYSTGSHSAREFAGGIEHIMVRGSQGDVLIAHVGKEVVLTVITKTHAELDHICLELKELSQKILAHLGSHT